MRSLGCTGFFGGVLGLVLVATLAGQLTSSGSIAGGVTDFRGEGRAFAFDLLKRTGLSPSVWTGRPGELADSPVELLWLPELPPEYRVEEDPGPVEGWGDWEDWEEPEPVDLPELETSFSATNYARFVARGGDIVVPVLSEGSLDLAEDLLGLERSDLRSAIFFDEDLPTRTGLTVRALVEDLTMLELFQDMARTLAELDDTYDLDADPDSDPDKALESESLYVERELLIEPNELSSGGLTVDLVAPTWGYSIERVLPADLDEYESPFALFLQVDAGRVVLLCGDDIVENGAAMTADHALVLVRFAELLDRRIWFDESVLRPSHGSWMGYLLRPPLLSLTLAVLLLALLAAVRSASRRGFPLEERLAHGPAPLERARGRAGLLLAAGRHGLLGTDLVEGVLRRLGVAHVTRPSGDDDPAPSAAQGAGDSGAAGNPNLTTEAAQLTLRLAAVAPSPDWLARAQHILGLSSSEGRLPSPPKTRLELEQLGRHLADIEARIHQP